MSTWPLTRTIMQALELHHINHARYPKSLGQLLIAPATIASDKDPWGKTYGYKLLKGGKSYELTSYGADGKPGGAWINADQGSEKLKPR